SSATFLFLYCILFLVLSRKTGLCFLLLSNLHIPLLTNHRPVLQTYLDIRLTMIELLPYMDLTFYFSFQEYPPTMTYPKVIFLYYDKLLILIYLTFLLSSFC